jgi:putative flavoprotein involved in K+ transport
MSRLDKELDVVVIGAGQAGLAMGYYLTKSKSSFVLVDACHGVGEVWRNRYDSLILFSPRAYSALPGMAMPGDLEGFPGKDEIANYLEHYCATFSIPVRLNMVVTKLERIDHLYKVSTNQGEIWARNVVVATGPFQKPFIPNLAGIQTNDLFQIHSSQYRNPQQIPVGPVLVVGGGNSGTQIAAELCLSRPVSLSAGHEMVFIPRTIWKRSIFWWLRVTGLYRVSNDSRLAKLLKKTEPVIGLETKSLLDSGEIKLTARVVSMEGHEVTYKDGTKEKVSSVIWATGFQYDYSWIEISGVLDSHNKPIHQRGVSSVKGIYFLGLPWLSRVGSAQINGVGYDAKCLAEHLAK